MNNLKDIESINEKHIVVNMNLLKDIRELKRTIDTMSIKLKEMRCCGNCVYNDVAGCNKKDCDEDVLNLWEWKKDYVL